jgi:Putative zinc-finger
MSASGPSVPAAGSPGWHADDELLARYVRGAAGPAAGASIEQHLTHCAGCRGRIATHVAAPALEAVWMRIREQAQAPARGPVERLLRRLGVPEPEAMLVAAAPSLRTSWLSGLAVTLAFTCLAATYSGVRGLAVFLLVAPLVPVAGVAFVYGPDADASYEMGAATPYSAARLLLLRTAAVLATSLPLTLAGAALLPALSWTAVAWLIPALAFTAVTLAGATFTRPGVVGTCLGVGWLAAVGAAALDRDPAAVLGPGPLAGYAVAGVVAMLVLSLRVRRLALLGSPS